MSSNWKNWHVFLAMILSCAGGVGGHMYAVQPSEPTPKPKPDVVVVDPVDPIVPVVHVDPLKPVPKPKPLPVDPATEIQFPILSVIPSPLSPIPTPAPGPDAVPVLMAETLYVVQSNSPFFLLVSPPKMGKVEYETGPIKIKGIFADGTRRETREYKSKYVATLESAEAATGLLELVGVPAGVQDESKITRRMIQLGTAPRPPPKPDPIDPTPVPTDDLTKRVSAAFGVAGKVDAKRFAAMWEAVGNAIATDQSVKTTMNAFTLSTSTERKLALDVTKYPAFQEIVKGRLSTWGKSEALTAESRSALSAACLELSRACSAAGGS